jgi:hypothetical protein
MHTSLPPTLTIREIWRKDERMSVLRHRQAERSETRVRRFGPKSGVKVQPTERDLSSFIISQRPRSKTLWSSGTENCYSPTFLHAKNMLFLSVNSIEPLSASEESHEIDQLDRVAPWQRRLGNVYNIFHGCKDDLRCEIKDHHSGGTL